MINFTKLLRPLRRAKTSLILHIGTPKTGSTAIQGLLAHNRDNLGRLHIRYPECGVPVNQHTALVRSIAAPLFEWAHFNQAIEQFDPVRYVDNILKQSALEGGSRILMSSEYFWASPAMQAGPDHHVPNQRNFDDIRTFVSSCRQVFSSFDDVKIVVYLRRQDEWLDSFFNQQVKDGFPIPPEEELLKEAKNYLLYHANLSIWAEYFGRENLIVRAYDNLPGKDVVKDFIQVAGIDPYALDQPARTRDLVNASLSRHSAALMKRAVDLQLEDDRLALLKQVVQRSAQHDGILGKKRGYTLFNQKFYSSVLELYREDNRKLAEDFVDLGLADAAGADIDPDGDEDSRRSEMRATEELISSLFDEIAKARGRR